MKDPKESERLLDYSDNEGDEEAMYNLVHFFETLIEMDRQYEEHKKQNTQKKPTRGRKG